MTRTKQTARKSTETGTPKPNYGSPKSPEGINCDESEDETEQKVFVSEMTPDMETNHPLTPDDMDRSWTPDEETNHPVTSDDMDRSWTPDEETNHPLTPDMENELENVLCEGGNVKEYISGRKVVFIVGGKRGNPIRVVY
jgi:hypothetical protein